MRINCKMNNKSLPEKAICSVTDLVKMLGLSRARFYQLQKLGFFPQSLYDTRTRRPFFDIELQKTCLKIRKTGIGFNDQYILFYSPRKKYTQNRTAAKRGRQNNPLYEELADALNSMGLNCSVRQVSDAIQQTYPDGIEELDQGAVLKDLFRFLKSK